MNFFSHLFIRNLHTLPLIEREIIATILKKNRFPFVNMGDLKFSLYHWLS